MAGQKDLVTDFGADPLGGRDTLGPLNASRAWLAAEPFRKVTAPPGLFRLSGEPDPFVGRNIGFECAGKYATLFRFDRNAGDSGTLCRVASGSRYVSLGGFGVQCVNEAGPLNHVFHLEEGVADLDVQDVHLDGVGAVIKSENGARTCFTRITGNFRADASPRAIWLAGGTNFGLYQSQIGAICKGSNDAVSFYAAPEAGRLLDTVKLIDAQLGGGDAGNGTGKAYGAIFDTTYGKIVNTWLTNAVFDETFKEALSIRAAPGSTSDLRHLWIQNTRFGNNAGKAATIYNDGTGRWADIKILDSFFGSHSDVAFDVRGPLAPRGLLIRGCEIQDNSKILKPGAMRFATGNWTVQGCDFVRYRVPGATSVGNTAYAIEVVADVDNFRAVDNDAEQMTSGRFLKHFSPYSSPGQRIVRGNILVP